MARAKSKKNRVPKKDNVTRKKTPQEIREEMLKQLKNSKLSDKK